MAKSERSTESPLPPQNIKRAGLNNEKILQMDFPTPKPNHNEIESKSNPRVFE